MHGIYSYRIYTLSNCSSKIAIVSIAILAVSLYERYIQQEKRKEKKKKIELFCVYEVPIQYTAA